MESRAPKTVQSAFAVLEEVARCGPGVTAQEISANLGIPRASAYRIIGLLVQDEYLVRLPDLRGFALGKRIVDLAHLVVPPAEPSGVAEVLSELRGRIRGGVHLVRYLETRPVVIDEDPDFPISDTQRLSRQLEVSAVGRLLLTDLARRDIALGRGTLNAAEISVLAQGLHEHGFTEQRGLLAPSLGCVAVPVGSIAVGAGPVAGAVAVSMPVARLDSAAPIVELLRSAATRLHGLM